MMFVELIKKVWNSYRIEFVIFSDISNKKTHPSESLHPSL